MLLLPFVMAMAVYANTLANGLVYDDPQTLRMLDSIEWSWANLARGRLGTYLVHAFDDWLWGRWIPGWHLTNVVLHALASVGASWIAYRLSSSRPVGLLCGLLFAVHPVHTEAVAAISYRKDVLAMICVCLALHFWLIRPRTALAVTAALACLALGILCKEVAVAGVIPMLVIADSLHRDVRPRNTSNGLRRAVYFSLTAAVALWLALTFLGPIQDRFTPARIQELTGGTGSYRGLLAASAASLPDVVRLLLFPHRFSPDYALRSAGGFDEGALLGAGVALAWALAAALTWRKWPLASFGLLWTGVTYAPMTNVIPLTHFATAERYLYVPSLGVCLLGALVVRGIRRLPSVRARWGSAWLAVLVLSCASFRTVTRNRDWKDDDSLWTAALRSGTGTWRTLEGAGKAAARHGALLDAEVLFGQAVLHGCPWGMGYFDRILGLAALEHGAFGEAATYFRRATVLVEDPIDLPVLLARALRAQGDLDGALEVLNEPCGSAYEGMRHDERGVILARKGLVDEAVMAWRSAILGDPEFAAPRLNLGRVLAMRGNAEAIEHLSCFERLSSPTSESRYLMGIACYQSGRYEDAEASLLEAKTLQPDNPDTLNGLGMVRAALGRHAEAEESWKRALEIDPTFEHAIHNLSTLSRLQQSSK